MKVKLRYIFLAAALLLIIGAMRKTNVHNNIPNTTKVSTTGYAAAEDFKIIDATTQLNHGQKGHITIQGKSGNKYKISTVFKRGNTVYYVNQVQTADKNGRTTFFWTVDNNTVPGTYPLTISCGSKNINLFHSVF